MALDSGNYDGTYETVAGNLALDFANTVSWRGSDSPHEWLSDCSNLAAWAQVVGLLTRRQVQELITAGKCDPPAGEKALEQAVQLREAIHRIFANVSAGEPQAEADLAVLNRHLAEAGTHRRLAPAEDGFSWEWAQGAGPFERLLWAVARSAAELLTSADLDRVGECQGEGCGWLFLDGSRNHSRRWCKMEDCGNRAKARRFYRRHKTA